MDADLMEPAALVPQIGRGVSLRDLAKDIAKNARTDVTGVHGGALALLLVETQRRTDRPIVVVVEDTARAGSLVSDLRYHAGVEADDEQPGEVIAFPQHDAGPYDRLAADRRSTMERAAALFRIAKGMPWRFVVVTAAALARKLLPRGMFEERSFTLVPGVSWDRDDLLMRLEHAGYHRAPLVEEMGTYAVRGSLVDVYPPYLEKPVRVDFFGNDVERIRTFDPDTQRTAGNIEQVWVHPVRGTLLPLDDEHRRAATQRLRAVCDAVHQPSTKTAELIDDFFSGRVIVGMDGFLPAVASEPSTFFDYQPSHALVCVEHPEAIRRAWQGLESRLEAEYAALVEEGRPAFPPREHLLSSDALAETVFSSAALAVHPLGIAGHGLAGAGSVVDIGAEATENLVQRVTNAAPSIGAKDAASALSVYLGRLLEEGYRTTVTAHTAGQIDRLATMLKARGLTVRKVEQPQPPGRPEILLAVGELTRGALLPGDGLCFITEEEVFGRRSRRAKKERTRAVSFDDLRSLSPNDLLVHQEHGVGRYEGLVRRRVRSFEMDFLLIVYQGGDKLYLPVYRLSQVQKYKGGGTERLDKLGGQTFTKAKSEVKKAAQEMAGRLLDLYARRAASQREGFELIEEVEAEFEAAFPYEETDDQARAIDEVFADLEGPRPMDRLVCGDVGFGKTEVAMRAAFRVAMTGKQVAVLVPTTVLAQQHYQTFRSRFSQWPIRVEMLSRFRSASRNRSVVLGMKDGTVDVVIGTHRLLSKDVHFRRLGLLVIDEEHRFGVTHKERIRSLRASVDALTMTATPIPRTLQLAFGAVRDLSLISTAPAQRRPVRTFVCHDDTKTLRDAMERELARDGQVFFVHNRVRDIDKVARRVCDMIPRARVAVGHGQMKEHQLEKVMLDFVAGRYDIFVCTTIIESGIDIPRANTMIIDRADTFGMAQLYQLRGRVGRSREQAYAYLVVPPLAVLSEEARQRVETLARYTELGSGFSVATMDMEMRGAGNILGPEQSGNVSAVGFEMFCDLLAEATAELRGETVSRDIEPELTFENTGFLPEEYLPDVGLRLSYYKRLASTHSEREVEDIAAELFDRYGPLPEQAEDLIRSMTVKALARRFGIAGIEATSRSLTIHMLHDSRVNPDVVVEILREEQGRVAFTRDLVIRKRFEKSEAGGVDGAIRFLHRLGSCDNNPSIL